MKNEIALRKACKDDAKAIWDIRNAAIISQCTGYYSPEALQVWTKGELTEQFIEVVENSFYVATLDGQAVGTGLSQLSLDSTLNAASFYHACGFIGDSVTKYESPRGISLDCVPMLKKLCKNKVED